MIFITLPSMLLALFPVILVEAYIYFRFLKVAPKKIFVTSLFSNLVSTVIGFPLTWGLNTICMLIIGLLAFFIGPLREPVFSLFENPFVSSVFFYAWLGPKFEVWMVLLAVLVHLIVAFWVSIFIEFKFTSWFLKSETIDQALLKNTVVRANLVSYFLLISVLVYAIWRHSKGQLF